MDITAGNSNSPTFTITPSDNNTDAVFGDLTVTPSGTSYSHTADTVTVLNDDTTPVASDSSASVNEDESITDGDLSSHTSDSDGDSLSYSVHSDVSDGVLTIDGDTGAWTYTPDANWNGEDSFVFTASDGTQSDNGTVTITVDSVNDAPVITEGESTDVTMSSDGSSSTLTPFSLTLNATDIEADTLTWSISGAASNGTAGASDTGSSKAITYTPNVDYIGSDSFTVRVFDGEDEDTITVNVTVEAERIIRMAEIAGYTWAMTPGPSDPETSIDEGDEVFNPVDPDVDQTLEASPASPE